MFYYINLGLINLELKSNIIFDDNDESYTYSICL